jgi:hypothetical protein
LLSALCSLLPAPCSLLSALCESPYFVVLSDDDHAHTLFTLSYTLLSLPRGTEEEAIEDVIERVLVNSNKATVQQVAVVKGEGKGGGGTLQAAVKGGAAGT